MIVSGQLRQAFLRKIPLIAFGCASATPVVTLVTFYECFNSKRDFWRNKIVDARSVEGTDKAVYQQIIDEYGPDSSAAHVEVYGQFPNASDDQFISNSLVDEAMERPIIADQSAPIVVGVDPARFGADATVIAIRQGRDIIGIRRYRGDDTMEVVGRVIDVIEEFKPALGRHRRRRAGRGHRRSAERATV